MGVLTDNIMEVREILAAAKPKAPQQAGLFAHINPATYNPNDPLPLWIIQVVIIMGVCQILAFALGRIRQPRVIAEVIGGVILGPTVMGRIPNFNASIFPTLSFPLLTLTANIGLVLFLFLVGLEVDIRVVKRNAKASGVISAAGLLVPLGMGAALGVPLYHQFADPSVSFGDFILFTAVAIGITAFPVLCRILTELQLLDTTVGTTVLAAGVGNDVVGWILLALTVALVNADSGLTALWVLLTGAGYVLFLLIPVRRAFRWLAKRTGSLESGKPTMLMMTLALLIILVSAFFTDVIGIHPIFGGFVAGLVMPRDNGFAIALVEKFEDLVSILFLPLYFALSGLKTNLGLLNDGITWAYVVLICVFAFVSKFFSCGIAAKTMGFNFRESGAIGALMSCKGLVELIVLNVGLSAGVLNTRVFSMFVVHALVLTFITTPLTILLYPAKCRVHTGTVREKQSTIESGSSVAAEKTTADDDIKSRFTVVLDKIEQLPAVMTLTQLLQRSPTQGSGTLVVDALRLIELDARTSTVLKSQEAEGLVKSDPILSVFRTFGLLNRLKVSSALAVVGRDEFADSVARHAGEVGSQMVVVPWCGSSVESTQPVAGGAGTNMMPESVVYSQFARKVFANAPTDVALFIDGGVSSAPSSLDANAGQHLFLPFFGGPDDRLALSFVVQLCMNENVSATVVRMTRLESAPLTASNSTEDLKPSALTTFGFADTVYGQQNTELRMQSTTADSLLWDRYTSSADTASLPADVTSALSRIRFVVESSAVPLRAAVESARSAFASPLCSRTPTVVVGRSRKLAAETHAAELRELVAERRSGMGGDVSRTLGDVAAAFVVEGVKASLIVVQAA